MNKFDKMRTSRLLFVLLWIGKGVLADLPCAKLYGGHSAICVCNSTYCDTITREPPKPGQFMMYTSSNAGSRFKKNPGIIKTVDLTIKSDFSYDLQLLLKTDKVYQSIEGFGGALTDSVGFNWMSLAPAVRQHIIDSYYGKDGIQYNMMRVPVGSSDFSPYPWSYNQYPINDTLFTNFTLSELDIKYKVPFIKKTFEVATDEVKIITSTWSPPSWMLEVNGPSEIKSVRRNFYQAYADYHCKFVELFRDNGINIWGMSPANEPLIPIIGGIRNESMGWICPDLANFWVENFGPTMRKCSSKVKLLGVEDQRFTIPLWFNQMAIFNPKVIDYIDGIAIHYYTDSFTSPAVITQSLRDYPDKFVLGTEASALLGVSLGSWLKAQAYARDILEDLNYNVAGWVDWNMCLNKHGGPTWTNNFVDSAVIVDATKDEFYKQPMFYVLGHFSKFLPRGSKRVKAVKITPGNACLMDIEDLEGVSQDYFDNVAFVTPEETVVVIIHNEGPSKNIAVRLGNQQMSATIEAESIVTVELNFPINIIT